MSCTLTPERRQELEQKLAEAEKAYHNLMLGLRARVIKDQTGEAVEYSSTTRGDLMTYINLLRNQLGIDANGCPIVNRGPIRFIF